MPDPIRSGPHPPTPGGVLDRLIFPCPAECEDTADACITAADSAAVTCAEAACASQITAAQTACTDSRTSQDCRNAVSVLRTCAGSCLDTHTSAVETCRSTLGDCLDACDTAQ